jgi:hypothetical protein
MESTLRTMAYMVEYPLLALVPAGAFFLLFLDSRNRFCLAVAVQWLLYMVYEYAMTFHILCSGECNIRVDLLLFYPVFLLTSLAALVTFAVWKSKK